MNTTPKNPPRRWQSPGFRAIACLLAFVSVIPVSRGQERNEEVTIIAPYQPTISDAFKMNFNPDLPSPEQGARQFQFDYLDKQLFAPITPDEIQPQRYSQMSEEELLRNYIKAGFGNYTTPYLEFFAGSLRSEKFQFSAHLRHLSSQGKVKDRGPSAYSHNLVEIGGKYFTRQHTLSGDIDYARDVYHFYGFEPDSFPSLEIDEDSLKQRFQNIGAGIAFESAYKDKTKLGHRISLGFYNYSDRYGTMENYISPKVTLNKGFDLFRGYPPQVIGMDLGLEYYSRKDSLDKASALLFRLRPWLDMNLDQYRIIAGFEVVTESDSATTVNFFPFIRGEVTILPDQLRAFAELKGGREVNSFKGLSTENPFVTSIPEIRSSVTRISIGGGIKGNAAGLNYFAGVNYRFVEDMPLFVNDTSLLLLNRFDVIYDNVSEFAIEAGAGYELPGTLNLLLSGYYKAYDTKDELKAWHKPSYRLALDGSYTFLRQYSIDASVFLIGPFHYRTFEGTETVAGKSEGAIDLNAGFKYQYNRNFSAFLKVNNILNRHYEVWYGYPTQGIQVLAGLGFSF